MGSEMCIRDSQNLLIAHHHKWLNHISAADRIQLAALVDAQEFNSVKHQIDETLNRYNSFTPIIKQAEIASGSNKVSLTERIDSIITHRILGPLIFFALMFFIFQAIFAWAAGPMDWIDGLFGSMASAVHSHLPAGWYTDLLADGVIAGLG